MAALKPSQIYASELLDANCCSPCIAEDGRQFESLEEAARSYPTGGYRNCEGGPRCRGTLVAVYDEAAPTVGPSFSLADVNEIVERRLAQHALTASAEHLETRSVIGRLMDFVRGGRDEDAAAAAARDEQLARLARDVDRVVDRIADLSVDVTEERKRIAGTALELQRDVAAALGDAKGSRAASDARIAELHGRLSEISASTAAIAHRSRPAGLRRRPDGSAEVIYDDEETI
jgi:hypothetical protein